MTAAAATRRVGGFTALPISVRVSSTKVTILRILDFIGSPQLAPALRWPQKAAAANFFRPLHLAETVLAFDFARFQAADPGMHARARGHHQRQQDYVGL